MDGQSQKGSCLVWLIFNIPEEWHPTNEVLEVIESAWMQVKITCEKIKEQTTATEKYISKMLNEIADHYQEN